jgi:hypothetical protein
MRCLLRYSYTQILRCGLLLGALTWALASADRILALAPTEHLTHRHGDSAGPVLPAALLPGETGRDRTGPAPRSEMSEESAALMSVARSYRGKTYIPYVWGGDHVGDQATCQACRACVEGKGRLKVERRARACTACRQCGVDCSHFVNRLYKEAGLPYPYLSTSKLKRLSASTLHKRYGLVDLGRDLSRAQPGDLLVSPRHVVMLLRMRDGTTGDFIHVSRSIKHGRMGGVEVVENQDLFRFRGRLVRILRHQALLNGPVTGPMTGPMIPSRFTGPIGLDGQSLVRTLPFPTWGFSAAAGGGAGFGDGILSL